MHHHQSTLEYSNSIHLHHHNTVSQEVGLEIDASLPYKVQVKEVQIVYRLFLVNCMYLGFLPSQIAPGEVEWLIDWFFFLPWQYIAMTRNNLSIILISLVQVFKKTTELWQNFDKFTYKKSNQLRDFVKLWGLLRKLELYHFDCFISWLFVYLAIVIYSPIFIHRKLP